jgi:hypothetical protein
LARGADLAVRLLNAGASGYPLNAVVTSTPEEELDLTDGEELPPAIGTTVARSLMAVIVGAYDGETFMIWQPSEADTRGE